jgi:hypothetical protein
MLFAEAQAEIGKEAQKKVGALTKIVAQINEKQ